MRWDTLNNPECISKELLDLLGRNLSALRVHRDVFTCRVSRIARNEMTECDYFKLPAEVHLDVRSQFREGAKRTSLISSRSEIEKSLSLIGSQ
jgi:hypothetical protein